MSSLHHRFHRRFLPGLVGVGLLLLFQLARATGTTGDPWAPFDAPWFDKVDVSEGLPHSITTAVAQDSRGLIWIGTMGGLVRYDGYRIQVFEAASRNIPGPPDAYVRNLLALPDGGMLIGTNAGGLARFDPADNTFHAYPGGTHGVADRKIYDLSDDHAGGVWIATEAGLDHLDLRSDKIEQLKTIPGTAPRNFSVLQDRRGNLWLGNNNGLFVRNAGFGAFERVVVSGDAASVVSNQIWALYEDREGRLWVGSGQAGAAYRDTDGSWHGVPGFSGHSHGAKQATVRDFLEASSNRIWIATDGSGVFEYIPGTQDVKPIQHDPAMASSLPGNSIRALLQDRSGNIWAATDLGIAHSDPHARTAFSLLPSPLEQHALSDTNVHSIFVDSRHRIWLGLGAGHIDMIELATGTMRHLHLGNNQAQRDVQAISESVDGSIWVGTQGLARIDPDTLDVHDSIVPALENKPVLSIRPDGATLLIGTYEGVYRYNTSNHSLGHFGNVPSDPTSLASETVRQIAQAGSDWWIGTTRGISIIHDIDSNNGFENLTHRAGDPSSLPQDYIGSIASDPKGRVWVSTYGGLGVLDHLVAGGPYAFRTVGLAQGLASDKVNAVLADDHDQLWASLSNDIAKIDGDTHAVQNLGTRDGLHILSYIHTAAARAPGGELLFGGLGGLTVIRPNWKPPMVAAAPLAITQAVLDGVAISFGKLPRDGDTITLEPRSRNLRADFALLDYKAPMETLYSYRMDGLDESWTEIPKGSLPSAIYTNLPHGDYRLQLRATTRGMHPLTVETSLAVVVDPRWYETISARVVAVLLLLATMLWLTHLRTLYLRRQAKQLQLKIDDQTRDLRLANQRLDELAGTDGLTGAYNRRRFLELAGGQRELAEDRPICIALFDLDRFKLINDTHGHLAGDAVIRTAIEVIKQHCRQGDLVGRYGGEEFVLCLPDTRLMHALETGERIRDALAATILQHDDRPISVTVSIGIAALRPGESIEQWLARADKALYEAKRGGRNRCVAAA
ncbi:MAG: diguanylate cyclase [Rhodanobacter sp.]